jgi:hypothetical protein
MLLHWFDGPKEYGCVYHKRAVHKLEHDDVVVDLFVMPEIERPIALTIGRYNNYQPVRPKQRRGFDDPAESPGRLEDVSSMFDQIGIDGQLSAYLGDEVDQFLIRETTTLREAIKSRA